MVKTILSFLLALIIFASCSNPADNEQPSTQDNNKEKQLQGLIEKYPDSSLLKENLIQYYRDSGYYDKALTETDKLLKKDSSNPRFWDIKATLYFENDDTLNAIHSFEKAVQLKPDSKYITSLGSLYAETKNPLAIKMADALLNSSSVTDKKEALFIKGLYYSYTDAKVKAISYFDSCLTIEYTDMYSYREKAICLYDLGKYNNALQVLQKAITVESNFDEGYFWMGKCFEKLGDKASAIESYQTALQIDKDYIEAKNALENLQ